MDKTELLRRVQEFASRNGLALGDELGSGVQGIVWSAKSQSEGGRLAIKVHKQEPDYRRERDAYLRLREHGITSIRGCNVPQLIAYDDDLWIITMTVVARPFVLDFGGAFLDQAPEFSQEILTEWRAEKMEQFEDRWPDVQAILSSLQAYGVFLIDVNPGNVSFGE